MYEVLKHAIHRKLFTLSLSLIALQCLHHIKSGIKGGLTSECFSLWLKSPNKGAKSLSLAYFI